MSLTRRRVTIDFPAAPFGHAEPQPDAWPLYSTDIRLVRSPTGDPGTFTLYGGKTEAYTLTSEEAEQLLHRLARMEVSAPWRPLAGFDGADYELVLRGAMSSMTFSWWVEAPPEWESVGEVFDYVMQLAQGQPGPIGD